MPSVAVTIPTLLGGTRLGKPMLRTCLQALDRQTFRDFEVVIVDNGQQIDPSEMDGLGFPVRILSPKTNIGFGAAINLAVMATEARLIATLNDDTEVDPEWLGALVQELESDASIGMCASSIRQFHEPCSLDSAGMLICLDGSSKQRGGSMPASSFAASEDVLLPSACAALYRRELLNEIGLFDEDFFLYCEDTDLGLRARWAGWRCRYVAAAGVRHHYSWTSQPFSPLKARFVERNRFWVAIKNFPLILLPAVPFVALLRYLWQLSALRSGQGAAAQFVSSGESLRTISAIILGAWLDTIGHMPALLQKRSRSSAGRRIGSVEFIRLLYRYRITAKELAFS